MGCIHSSRSVCSLCSFQGHLSYDASSRPVTRLHRRHVRSRDQDPWSRGCSRRVRFAGFHFWELNGGEVEMCLRTRQETWEIAGRGYPGNVRFKALWRGICWLTHWGRDDIEGLVQDCISNRELVQSCTKPSICHPFCRRVFQLYFKVE